jgi:hypothetical protein
LEKPITSFVRTFQKNWFAFPQLLGLKLPSHWHRRIQLSNTVRMETIRKEEENKETNELKEKTKEDG